MPNVSACHSVNEVKKPPMNRVYHNNSALGRKGRDIPENERKLGNGGYRLCEDCSRLKSQSR